MEIKWIDTKVKRPEHMQRCFCYDSYMSGFYVYVYDDISKYWCSQTTEEHDPDGENHVCDYADNRVIAWSPIPRIRKDKVREFLGLNTVWHDCSEVPKYNLNGSTDFIIDSFYGHIEGEAHSYTPEQWSAHLGFVANREFRWAYEKDLIYF